MPAAGRRGPRSAGSRCRRSTTGGSIRPRAGAARAAHLEHVAEVGGELQAQRDRHLVPAVVAQPHALVEPVLPEQARALDVDDALRRRRPADRRQRPVGEVGGEEDVVLADGARRAATSGRPPMLSRKRDRMRVSSWNRPSPAPWMSPKASATTNMSPCFRTNRRGGPRGSSGPRLDGGIGASTDQAEPSRRRGARPVRRRRRAASRAAGSCGPSPWP